MATTSSLTRQIRATVLGRAGVGSIDFNQFRRLRKQLNVSQDDVAGWVGVNRTSISHWERGRKTPSADHARQVAEIITELSRLAGVVTSDNIRREYNNSRPRGPMDWHPKSKSKLILSHVLDVLEELRVYWSLTLRYVQYRLMGKYAYEKGQFDSIQYVIDKGRRSGMIQWEAIADGRSSSSQPFQFDSPEDFHNWLGEQVDRAQLPRQNGQEQFIEVWCEAQGTVPKLKQVCHEYGVPLYTSSGYNTTTSRYYGAVRAVHRFRSSAGRKTHILHLGDHDDDGVKVYNALLEDVEAWCEHYEPGERIVTFERLAILPSQIEKHVPDRLWQTPKATWKDWEWPYAAQLEALDLRTLIGIVRGRLDELTDAAILKEVTDGEVGFRDELRGRYGLEVDEN